MKSLKFTQKFLVIGVFLTLISACKSSGELPTMSWTPSVSASNSVISNSCLETSIEYSWEEPQGAAGTTYRLLAIKNLGPQECQILTTPEISLFENKESGFVVKVREQEGLELGFPIAIKSMQKIILPIGTANPDNFDANICLKKTANFMSIKISDLARPVNLEVHPWDSCSTDGNGPFFAPVGSQ